MDFDISTIMLFFFILFMIVGIWKIYAFLPNKQLPDDDTTPEATDELLAIVVQTIVKRGNAELSLDELYVYVMEEEDFDKKRFWRFNKNRLKKILDLYYLKNPHAKSIADILDIETRRVIS